MIKFRNILIGFFCIFFIGCFFWLDYSNLSWSNNRSTYIGFVVCILNIVVMIMSNRQEKRKKENQLIKNISSL